MGRDLRGKKGALTWRGRVYFLGATHLLHASVPSQGWMKHGQTRTLRTNSGRNRLNVLGASSPDDQSLISLEGRESCDAERVAQLLHTIRPANPGRRLLVVLDNAPYTKAAPVTEAAALRIELLYLPPYSPNLNLIERFWKYLKGKVTRNRYHATFAAFRSAVQAILNHISDHYTALESRMTERFQLFARP